MLFLAIILVAVIGIVIYAIWDVDIANVIGIIALIVAGIMLICAFFSYGSSLDTVAEMENFYERNGRIFSEAVVAFPDAVTVKTSDNTTQTVKLSWDYTKEILSYNNDLKWYKKYQNHWFYSFFIAHVPDKLEYIELNSGPEKPEK